MLSAADRAGGVTLPLGLGKRHWNLAFLQIPAAGAVIFRAGVRDVNRLALVVRAAVSRRDGRRTAAARRTARTRAGRGTARCTCFERIHLFL